MKRMIINAGKIGLIFRNGDYQGLITEGTHWIAPFKEVKIYDMAQAFYSPIELNILLKDTDLAQRLTVIEVKDNEIALQFENGNFKNVLGPGRYAYWKGMTAFSFIMADISKAEIPTFISVNLLQKPQLLPYVRTYAVEPYEKAILYIDGKFVKVLESGVYYFWKNAIPVFAAKADLRQLQMEISGQEILSKDKAALRVSFYIRYKVVDILKALNENKEYDKQLYVLVQLALREYTGAMTLDEMLDRKESISEYVIGSLKEKASSLGVEIKGGGIRDIILPGEVREIMNQVLVAQKKAQANIITRREETASTRSLLNTARLLEENVMLYKLKEMEYVEKIADKINSISLSGGNQLVDQLKTLFVPGK